jgi:hypothetical protein
MEKYILKDLSDISDVIYSGILFKKDLYVYNSDILDIISVINIVIRIELNK